MKWTMIYELEYWENDEEHHESGIVCAGTMREAMKKLECLYGDDIEEVSITHAYENADDDGVIAKDRLEEVLALLPADGRNGE